MHRTQNNTVVLLLATAVLLLAHTGSHAQPNTWIDPRHPSVAWLQEWGYMSGTGLPCKAHWGEEFGRSIIPLGDVNGDAIADFILERSRCDTAFAGVRPNELLLYYGTQGRLPASASGKRIGPSEIGSETKFLCTGDWDDNSFPDLALTIRILGDTSNGNVKGYSIVRVVIFWGSSNGYSLSDTTRLLANDSDYWLGAFRAITLNFLEDDADDLLVWGGGGLIDGNVLVTPIVLGYAGSATKRWGAQGGDRRYSWHWWTPPPFNVIDRPRDYDCDGFIDVALINQTSKTTVSIIYGQQSNVLDTANIERIEILPEGGKHTLFQDVTGDRIPDLIVRSGDFEQGRIRIFAGAPGQRLKEQYGTGTDSADRANNRFPLRPWAQIISPNALHEGWFDWENFLFDLGDVNDDGTSEIVAFSKPFLLFYTTGNTLDSLIDIMFQVPSDSWATIRRMGDVDGSGKVSYAVNFDEKIHFLKAPPKDEIPTYGGRLRSLPHPRDFRCEKASSVQEEMPLPDTLDLSQQGLLFPDIHSFYHHR